MVDTPKQELFRALGLVEVVNEDSLIVTVRMPRSIWEVIHRLAGAAIPQAPKTGVRKALDAVFPPPALFGRKDRK